tara:strand:+ start:35 stop:247 length:213 start_codon:yes stop_codon:yes gene_type:complete
MPRKQIIKRKVRRLTSTEIDYLLNGVIAYDDHLQADWDNFEEEGLTKKAEEASQSLQGLYKNLAIIIEEE